MHLDDYKAVSDAHRFGTCNEVQLQTCGHAGCFHCIETFHPAAIVEWVKEPFNRDGPRTALCPHCGIDSVIGDTSGYLTREFLMNMHERWFSDAAGKTMWYKEYKGISYPTFLDNRPVQWLWKKFMCPRNFHLFDEVLSIDHSLSCDACGLQVKVDVIMTEEESCKPEHLGVGSSSDDEILSVDL